jgi:beta-xylosidase
MGRAGGKCSWYFLGMTHLYLRCCNSEIAYNYIRATPVFILLVIFTLFPWQKVDEIQVFLPVGKAVFKLAFLPKAHSACCGLF